MPIFTEIILEVNDISKVALSWILKHPTDIIPVIGSGKISRIKSAVEALKIEMSLEQWYRFIMHQKERNFLKFLFEYIFFG